MKKLNLFSQHPINEFHIQSRAHRVRQQIILPLPICRPVEGPERRKRHAAPRADRLQDLIRDARRVKYPMHIAAVDVPVPGPSDEIYYDPRHPYTWALLSSMPQMGVKGEDLFNIQGTPPNLFTEIHGDAFAPRNPLALKIDFVKRPPYFDVSTTHRAKTWLLDPRAPKIEPPAAVRMLQEEGK